MRVVEAAIVIVSILVLGVVDYVTGYDFSFFVFYFIPIAIVASRHEAKVGFVVSVFCALTWFISDKLTGHPYPNAWIGIWNGAARLAAFVVVAYTIARIRSLLESAQKEVKTLQGFLPICAKCKRIRDDKGYWQQIESYISQRADVRFTHGLCEHCAAEMMSEYENAAGTDRERGH